MTIIISNNSMRALDWARMGRLSAETYYIVTNAQDCQKLLRCELKFNDTIARVGDKPKDYDYIDTFIKTRIR